MDWRREILEFLEERVKYYERLAALEEAARLLEKHPVLPRGLAAGMVRRDRDSG